MPGLNLFSITRNAPALTLRAPVRGVITHWRANGFLLRLRVCSCLERAFPWQPSAPIVQSPAAPVALPIAPQPSHPDPPHKPPPSRFHRPGFYAAIAGYVCVENTARCLARPLGFGQSGDRAFCENANMLSNGLDRNASRSWSMEKPKALE